MCSSAGPGSRQINTQKIKNRSDLIFMLLTIPYRKINRGLVLLFLALLLSGCTEKHTPNVSIEMITLDKGDDGEVMVPKFMTSDGSDWAPVNDLNRQVLNLENLYLNAQADQDHSFILESYPDSSNPDYLQVTLYTEESYGSESEANLLSLVYDQNQGIILRNQDALTMAGITGVQVSSAVGKAYPSFQKEGDELHSTEVQGFTIDENGKVADFYVKLFIDTEETDLHPDGKYELFYVYHTEDGSVAPFPFR